MKKIDINKLVRRNVLSLKPYSSARAEFNTSESKMIFLDGNENPYESNLNRYPDPLQNKLKKELASFREIDPENIFIGNGSDDVIGLIINLFCDPLKDSIMILPPTFGMFEVLAKSNNVNVNRVALNENFQPDVTKIMNNYTENTKLLFFASPNNPTGNDFDLNLINKIVNNFPGIIVIDKAYHEFSNQKDVIGLIKRNTNVIICETFSKAQGLAGARVGMAYSNKEIITFLNKIKYPYNLNVLSQKAAIKRLLNKDLVEDQVKEIISERNKISLALKQIKFVKKVFPSNANFILIRVDDSNLRYKQLIDHGLVVRNTSNQIKCENTLRISIGKPNENKVLIKSLKKIEEI